MLSHATDTHITINVARWTSDIEGRALANLWIMAIIPLLFYTINVCIYCIYPHPHRHHHHHNISYQHPHQQLVECFQGNNRTDCPDTCWHFKTSVSICFGQKYEVALKSPMLPGNWRLPILSKSRSLSKGKVIYFSFSSMRCWRIRWVSIRVCTRHLTSKRTGLMWEHMSI